MNTKTTVITQEQLASQFSYCDKIAAYWHETDTTPTAYVETYGCQQNEADSEKLRGYLAQSGYAMASSAEGADVVVMNTCAIREHAEQRVFGALGELTHTKRRHPGQKIFLCGCMAGEPKVSNRIKMSFPHVDGVFSTHHLWQFPEILWNVLSRKKRQFYVEDEPGSIAEGIPQVRDNTLKSWVSIMYGCNNFCTYCIVPYVRGRERSRKKEDILAEQTASMGLDPTEFLGYNPYTASIEVKLKAEYANTDSIVPIKNRLMRYTKIREISYPSELMDNVNENIRKISALLLALALALSLISFALISNTIKLTIYSQRFLLHTMKLVGASWRFIRRPFLMRNLGIGIASGLLANGVIGGGIWLLLRHEPQLKHLFTLPTLGVVGGSVMLFGILITLLCAYASINRFLRMKAGDLYYI